jgi:hypothetical protein
MDDVLMRFVDEAPIAVMVRSALEHVFCDATLDSIFSRSAERQYTKHLTFSALTRLMTKVTFCTHDSVHAAYRHSRKNQEITVSIAAVYDKLGGLESATSEAMVCELGQRMSAIIEALPRKLRDPVPGLRLKTLDGNFLAGTDHRLKCLRGCGAAALPGMSLVVRDGRTGLLTNLIAREDAYTNELTTCWWSSRPPWPARTVAKRSTRNCRVTTWRRKWPWSPKGWTSPCPGTPGGASPK